MYSERSKSVLTVVLAIVTLAIMTMGTAYGMMMYNLSEEKSVSNISLVSFIEMNAACDAEVIKIESDSMNVNLHSDAKTVAVKTNAVKKNTVVAAVKKAETVTENDMLEEDVVRLSEDAEFTPEDSIVENNDMTSEDVLEEDSIRETEVEFN